MAGVPEREEALVFRDLRNYGQPHFWRENLYGYHLSRNDEGQLSHNKTQQMNQHTEKEVETVKKMDRERVEWMKWRQGFVGDLSIRAESG